MRDLRSTLWRPSLAVFVSASTPEVGRNDLTTLRLDAPPHAQRGDGGR